MQEKVDIYGYDRKLGNTIKAFEVLSKTNKELLLKFKTYLLLRNLSKPRILKYLGFLKNMGILIEKKEITQNNEFDKLTKQDIQAIVGMIQEKDYSPWTRHGYKIIIKQFIKWVKNYEGDDLPEEVKWIKACVSRSEIKLPGEGDLITKEEVDSAINNCNLLRDKAFLSIVYESGCRIGELGSLRISNIVFDKYGAQIHILGKTGGRRIRLVNSSFILRTYIESHPHKLEKTAPLWYNSENINSKGSLTYGALKKIIKKAFKNAGIKKRCNPHLFRHSRATEMASHLTEFQMNQYFGWIQGSNMPSTYVHMNGKEVDSAILEMNGIKTKEGIEDNVKPIICQRCEFLNPSGTEFCLKCSLPLQMKAAVELQMKEQEKRRTDIMMNELINQPEIQKLLLDKMKELGFSNGLV